MAEAYLEQAVNMFASIYGEQHPGAFPCFAWECVALLRFERCLLCLCPPEAYCVCMIALQRRSWLTVCCWRADTGFVMNKLHIISRMASGQIPHALIGVASAKKR